MRVLASGRRAASALLLAAAALALQACGRPEPLRIGFIGGLSGRVADLGVAGRNGAMLAVEQRNAAGGINGRPVELVVRDDRQDAAQAQAAMRELVGLKVAAVVGPMTSAMAVAVAPLADASQTVLVSPTATTNELAEKDDYFLRVIARTREYARRNAQHLGGRLGLTRIVALYDMGNRAYTESWLADFRAAFEKGSGSVIASLPFQSGGEVHLDQLAEQALAAGGDGVLILANSLDTAMLCQQLRLRNRDIPIAAAEWGGTERLLELGGSAVEGLTVAQFVDRDSRAPAYVAFREAYLKRFGLEPGFAGVAAFDATQVVLQALASAPGGAALKQHILATGRYPGLQADVVFDAHGDASRPTFLTTVHQGRFVAKGP